MPGPTAFRGGGARQIAWEFRAELSRRRSVVLLNGLFINAESDRQVTALPDGAGRREAARVYGWRAAVSANISRVSSTDCSLTTARLDLLTVDQSTSTVFPQWRNCRWAQRPGDCKHIAAAQSTVSSSINCSAVILYDIYKRYVRPGGDGTMQVSDDAGGGAWEQVRRYEMEIGVRWMVGVASISVGDAGAFSAGADGTSCGNAAAATGGLRSCVDRGMTFSPR
jgi:hypothetical protein